MAILRKENVTLQEIDLGKIKELKAQGYKEVDENGKFIGGEAVETVSLSDFQALEQENAALKSELENLKTPELTNDEIKAKLDELGVEYGAKDTKPTLLELLDKANKE